VVATRGSVRYLTTPPHNRRGLGRRAFLFGAAGALIAGCRRAPARREVVVYTSLDEPYSRPVLEAFTRDTGITARPVYDTEANKSRGLAQRILAEQSNPRADVFWSSEILQTLRLQQAGALAPYASPSAEPIPEPMRDPKHHWTGFAARFRVLAYDRRKVKAPPRSLLDLTDAKWRGEVAMANPLFGTTTTEVAAVFQTLGSEAAEEYYRKRRENRTRIVDGNAVAVDEVARGNVLLCQTDTDDAYSRQDAGADVGIVFPDQGGFGALLIPNTVALVRNAPHGQEAAAFVDYLLKPDTELMMAAMPSRQVPLNPGVRDRVPEAVKPQLEVQAMAVDWNLLAIRYEEVDGFLRSEFLQT
jgi:iron(III) transport system substrate-binding protein